MAKPQAAAKPTNANRNPVAQRETTQVTVLTERPEWMREGGKARGSENVGTEDMVIPRLEIVQSLSPARDKRAPEFIEGAEEGLMYNNVTRQLYGTELLVVPVLFKKQYLIWRDRKLGGGFRGAYDSRADAEVAAANEEGEGWEAVETHQHFCLAMTGSSKPEQLVISMSRSKIKVSKKFNSMIMNMGGDRFSRVYKFFAVEDTNDQNQKYFNFGFQVAGFPNQAIYAAAEDLYNKVTAGMNIVADTAFDEPRDVGGGSTEY